jgi:hypothetical protein
LMEAVDHYPGPQHPTRPQTQIEFHSPLIS